MEYAVGVIVAVAVGLFAGLVGFDRERSFYAVALIVVAHYYLLFAAMAASTEVLLVEAVPALLFVAAAAIGFRRSPWIVASALAFHGVFDLFHHTVIANPGVPLWWPGFCMAFDVAAGAWLALLLVLRRDGGTAGAAIK